MSARRHFPHGLSHNLKSGMRGEAKNARKLCVHKCQDCGKCLFFLSARNSYYQTTTQTFAAPRRESDTENRLRGL